MASGAGIVDEPSVPTSVGFVTHAIEPFVKGYVQWVAMYPIRTFSLAESETEVLSRVANCFIVAVVRCHPREARGRYACILPSSPVKRTAIR